MSFITEGEGSQLETTVNNIMSLYTSLDSDIPTRFNASDLFYVDNDGKLGARVEISKYNMLGSPLLTIIVASYSYNDLITVQCGGPENTFDSNDKEGIWKFYQRFCAENENEQL